MTRARNWLVTGGCGFIGGALVERLRSAGHKVRVFDDLSVGSTAALPGEPVGLTAGVAGAGWSGLELVEADIRDAGAMAAATVGADCVVHLAANTGVAPSVEDPEIDCDINVRGTLNTLEAARGAGVGRFVFASSGAPLGEQTPPLDETKVPRPKSPYGASKLAGEGYCSAYWGSFGLETVALRFGNVYGPGCAHKDSVVARFLRRALAGEPLEIYGDGSQTRDFVYIGDILEAIQRAAEVPDIGGEIFQIATATERTVNEVAQAIGEIVRARTGLEITIEHGASRQGDVARNYSDTSKARARLGFEPQTSLQAGLEATLDYLMLQSAA